MNVNQDNSKSLKILKSPLPKCKQIGSLLSTYSSPQLCVPNKNAFPEKNPNKKSILEK